MGFIVPAKKAEKFFKHGVDCHVKASGFCTLHWVNHNAAAVIAAAAKAKETK